MPGNGEGGETASRPGEETRLRKVEGASSQQPIADSQQKGERVKITDVQAIILRQPTMDVSKADGSQDALLIRIETDEGITGIGEVDSLPSVIKSIVDAPAA